MQPRIQYIDVFKGILIIMVVFGHIVYVMGISTGVNLSASPYWWTQYIASVWVAPYYMAAFFIASGYCSKFKRSMREQVVGDAKRLIVPAIIVPIIMKIVTPPLNDINVDMFIIKGKLPWFLLAMFFARLFYKISLSLKCKWRYRILINSIVSVGSCWILRNHSEYNFLYIFHGMAFVVFIDMGRKLRKMNIGKLYVISAIVIYCLLVFIFSDNMPSLCANIYFEVKEWPLYVIAVLCGTLVAFKLSEWIHQNVVLEYLGKNSLVIYLTHCEFIRFMSAYMIGQISESNNSLFGSTILVLFMLIGGICWGAMCSWIFNRKYTKWIIGG